jgi:DNA-binding CsgD family transcriptional regulator
MEQAFAMTTDTLAAALAASYELTPAETRLLEAFLQGERIADYAERTGISMNTVQTHLKRIFEKTGTNRQAELMRHAFVYHLAAE